MKYLLHHFWSFHVSINVLDMFVLYCQSIFISLFTSSLCLFCFFQVACSLVNYQVG